MEGIDVGGERAGGTCRATSLVCVSIILDNNFAFLFPFRRSKGKGGVGQFV